MYKEVLRGLADHSLVHACGPFAGSVPKIEAGQELTFACGDKQLRSRIVRVAEYPSFEEMVDHKDPVAFGDELGRDRDGLPNVILAIHPLEERSGVWAIEIEKLADSTVACP